jgi:hypothetical protein
LRADAIFVEDGVIGEERIDIWMAIGLVSEA